MPIKRIPGSDNYLQKGRELFLEQKALVTAGLGKFISLRDSLDGTMMQEDWFPSIYAEVFVSHSHANENDALKLAGWLKDSFGITAFIDSCIWGNADDLLKMIDNEYCFNPDKETYSYEKRNLSTSHVHMMLSVALSKMIDKTECLFFLNTPYSVTTSEIIKKTSSPWIYSEIAMARLLRKPLEFHRENIFKSLSEGSLVDKRLKIEYELGLDEFTELGIDNLNEWQRKYQNRPRGKATALDVLYHLHPASDEHPYY